jgi:hypothetical protein
VVAASILAACGDGEATPLASEDGAVVLVETQPQSLGAARVVASNVRADEARVSITGDDGEGGVVAVGDTVTIEGETWEVIDIRPGADGGVEPGSKTGRVVIAPR